MIRRSDVEGGLILTLTSMKSWHSFSTQTFSITSGLRPTQYSYWHQRRIPNKHCILSPPLSSISYSISLYPPLTSSQNNVVQTNHKDAVNGTNTLKDFKRRLQSARTWKLDCALAKKKNSWKSLVCSIKYGECCSKSRVKCFLQRVVDIFFYVKCFHQS